MANVTKGKTLDGKPYAGDPHVRLLCNRREFLGVASAFGAAGAAGGAEARTDRAAARDLGPVKLRVGIVSDIHITNDTPGRRDSNEHFIKALRYFDAQKVDAVLVAGDLFTTGRIRELEFVAEAWNAVFPHDRAADGRPVARLFVTGNHDVEDWTYQLQPGETAAQKAERVKGEMFAFHRAETWRRLFGEDYAPYGAKTVKGYTFVLRNWPSAFHGERPAVEAAMAEWGPKVARDKVFFYCQHEQADDTVNASWLVGGAKWDNGQDGGLTKRVLSAYPNCVCLTGHSHNSLADERSIWQGAYTAVNCGCLVGWAFAGPGRENGHDCDGNPAPVREMPVFDKTHVYQGLLMTVYGDAIRFHRREFVNGGVLGDDWIVPLGTAARPYAFAPRVAASRPPRFAADAQVAVRTVEKGRDRAGDVHPQVEVAFPSVTSATGGDRAHDYAVRVEMMIGDVVRTVDEKRVFSDRFMWSEADDRSPVRCLFAKRALPAKRLLRFVVTPYNCWMKPGESIATNWKVYT